MRKLWLCVSFSSHIYSKQSWIVNGYEVNFYWKFILQGRGQIILLDYFELYASMIF
jgi:hypothetical protein